MYLNVTEIESGLRALAATYPNTCALVELPHKTHEGRSVYALHLGRRDTSKLNGVYFTGGVHSREWGTVDICVHFAADLLEAYAGGTGLGYGAVAFSAADVKTIIEGLDVIVLACANPDGLAWDRSLLPAQPADDADGRVWRKNRRVNAGTTCVGVDLNRNHDILWDSDKHLHPSAAAEASSPDPCDSLYRGPSPTSEPEARNVAWVYDAFPNIGYYMDIHAYSGDVLYPWGHAPNQSNNPGMNFRNPAFDGQRGLPNGPYGEYIEPADETVYRAIAFSVARTINSVRGLVKPQYVVKQSFFLDVGQTGQAVTYPTTGANDDYAYSRHLTDRRAAAVMGFTMEFNVNVDFYPPWSEMEQHHIPDACAGLVAFCLQAYRQSFAGVHVPEIFGQVFGGVDVGGGGWIVLPSGKIIRVPPRQDRVLQALEALGAYLAAGEIGPEIGRDVALAALGALEQVVVMAREQVG